MPVLVKITMSDDMEFREKEDQFWHLVDLYDTEGGRSTLCEGEFFGIAQSGCEYELKATKRGGVTCPKCLKKIRGYKSIKL